MTSTSFSVTILAILTQYYLIGKNQSTDFPFYNKSALFQQR